MTTPIERLAAMQRPVVRVTVEYRPTPYDPAIASATIEQPVEKLEKELDNGWQAFSRGDTVLEVADRLRHILITGGNHR